MAMVKGRRDYGPLARRAAEAAADKKALDIRVLDIRGESDVADYMVVAGAASAAQMRAVQMAVGEALERDGLVPLHQEGQAAGRWLALDYGGLVVHILLPEAREFYRLEQMWETAKEMKWQGKPKRRSKK